MLTDRQEEIIAEALRPLFEYLEHEVIVDTARRIKETMAYTRTAELRVEELQRLGFSPARIRKEAMKILKADPDFRKAVAKNTLKHKREVKKILRDILKAAQHAQGKVLKGAADLSYLDDLKLWKQGGKEIERDSFLPQLTEGIRQQTSGNLKNLTGTTGFKDMSGYEPMETLYRRELDKAMIKVCTGTYSAEQAVYDTVHRLAESGLRTIDFASGYSMLLDTAVKLAVRTGAHQLAAKIMDENIKKTGENLVYVSKHWGARNKEEGHANHEEWQGKVYFIKAGADYTKELARIGQTKILPLWEATGYSMDGEHENDPTGLNGYNCRHRHYVWFEGISQFPDEDPEPDPVVIDGKTYDYYAITQKMRYQERTIRGLKREREALRSLNMDTKAIDSKIRQKIREYESFCAKGNVKPETNRLRYECGTSDLSKTEAWKRYEETVTADQKEVAERLEYDKMNSAKEEKGINVHTVGRIDKSIYEVLTKEIRTDEVIITEERIEHIKQRRGEDFYEKYSNVFIDVLRDPDYIFADSREHTGLVCKKIVSDGKFINIVLRIAIETDDPKYKNSIITVVGEGEKRFRQRLKNNTPLYKKE